jgi:hypothetical protein
MKLVLDTNHLGLKSLAVLFLVWLGWYIYSSLKLRARMNKLGKRAVMKRNYLPFGIDTMLKTVIVLFSLEPLLTIATPQTSNVRTLSREFR